MESKSYKWNFCNFVVYDASIGCSIHRVVIRFMNEIMSNKQRRDDLSDVIRSEIKQWNSRVFFITGALFCFILERK